MTRPGRTNYEARHGKTIGVGRWSEGGGARTSYMFKIILRIGEDEERGHTSSRE